MSNKLRVLVLFGGRSTEHAVSIRSATSIINALDPTRYDVIPGAISRSGQWLSPTDSARLLTAVTRPLTIPDVALIGAQAESGLIRFAGADASTPHAIDVVFPVLHGTYGEDGTVQGLLELADLPYVGSGVLGSAIGMDKEVAKRLLRQAGLPTPEFMLLRRADWRTDRAQVLSAVQDRFNFPIFSKPANSGSSVGILKVHDASELAASLEEAFRYDRKVLVEESISGRELECSVLGNDQPRASVVGEVIPGSEYYDYAEKYLKDTTKLVIPADLPDPVSRQIRRLAVQAFQVLEGQGFARVDFFLEHGSGRALINEINTIPGFTSISMYPKLWEASGLGYSELVDELIRLARERHDDRAHDQLSYTE